MNALISAQWSSSTLGEQFNVQLGKMLDAARNTGECKPYLGNRAVQWGRIDVSAAGVVPMTRTDMHRYRLRRGDLLVCEGGEVGRAAIWHNQLAECYFQKALHRLRPKHGYDVRLMLAFLEYWASTGAFANYVTQTSIAHLPREKFIQIPLPVPPLSEQQRLGELLDDLNGLVATLQRLIAKKQAIKRGMLQELLTSESALPDSPSSGSGVTLGEITTWLSGGTPDRNNPAYWGGTIPWISAATLKHSRVHDSDQHLTVAGLRAGSRIAPAGATLVLVRGMALHRETRIGMATRPVSFNQDVKALIPKLGVLPEYLVCALQARSSHVLDLVSSAGSGTGVLDTQLLQRLPVWVPDETSQRRIVTAINAVDRNVEALDRSLSKMQAIKQGMMQTLLTGRTRMPGQGEDDE